MNVAEALGIFGKASLNDVNEAEIKVIYRNLMKVNHPDVGSTGNEEGSKIINEAYQMLQKLIKNEKETKVEKDSNTYIIPFDRYIDLYNGGSIEYNMGSIKKVIDRSNVMLYNAVIKTEILVIINGVKAERSSLEIVNKADEYSIALVVGTKDPEKNIPVEIRAYGKEMKVNLRGSSLNVKMRFDNNIFLTVKIERKVYQNERN